MPKKIPEKGEPENKGIQLTQKGYVTLPFDESEFREFIVGLLGKPQTITAYLDGVFEIEKDEIVNLYNLIHQRITQQNDATLIQFSTRIVYSDDTSVLLNGYDQFLTYNEIKPVISTAIHLTWTYLIKFRDKNVPEKQEINVSFVSSRYNESFDTFQSYEEFLYHRYKKGRLRLDDYIQFEIRHTARTWGTDIEALLSNHFNSIIKTETAKKKWVRKSQSWIGVITGFIIFGIFVTFSSIIYLNFENNRISKIEELFDPQKSLNLEVINERLEFIAKGYPNTDYSVFVFLAGLLTSMIIGSWIAEKNITYPSSYILLTKESYKFKSENTKKYIKGWQNFFFSISIGIFCSLIANYLFILLKSWFSF